LRSQANALASIGDSLILLDGTYDWPSTQTLTKALSVVPAPGANPILTSTALQNVPLISIATSPVGTLVSLSGIKIDLSTKSDLSMIGISALADVNVYNSVILCNTAAIDACSAISATSVRLRLENVTVSVRQIVLSTDLIGDLLFI
jgi:hypothetical protein